ncbi:hypothetical protein [Paucibacter sp. KCTC 42545]|uniref:hypothetical protein n=1 Tax=Paucibacter sp. KCTC 42545 TaxID=1768242 RepID=UPI000733BC6F|nr:hypothetical protein [Paucibacter sp. KCTC 42545]ALT79173.1 hypothetical protein AT984_20245 [Paucibacter sp. KCTC 42545]
MQHQLFTSTPTAITPKRYPGAGTAALLSVLLLSACALPTARMTPPPDIAPNADVLEVANRSSFIGALVDESFDVGPYRVTEVKRGWGSNSSTTLGNVTVQKSSSGFRFGFNGTADHWQGRCDYRAQSRLVQLGNVGNLEEDKANLRCSCRSDNKEREVSFDLDDEWRPLRGALLIDASRYEVQQYSFGRHRGGLKSPASGYRVEREGNGTGVAAVEVLHPGRIWLQRSLPAEQREPMACLMSALMIYGSQ